jgi:dienelactone hydrolase
MNTRLALLALLFCLPAAPATATLSVAEVEALLNTDRSRVRVQCGPAREEEGCQRSLASFLSLLPSPYPVNQRVLCRLAEGPGQARRPAVIVLGVRGYSGDEISGKLCRKLAQRGMVAVSVPLPYHGARRPPRAGDDDMMTTADLDHTVRAFAQAVVDIRCVVDWLQTRPEVDPERIGVAGMSLGGMAALLTAQVEPRIKAAVTIASSGDLATMIRRSGYAFDIRWKLARRGMSQAQIRRAMAPIDPATYAGRNPGLKLLMINGRYDLVMPTEAVRNTWRALGKPQIIWLDSGHLSTFIYQGESFGAAASFLAAEFGMAPERPLHPRSVATNAGIMMAADSGVMAAVMVDAVRLSSHAPVFLSAGVTSRGPMLGANLRLGDFVAVGYGIRPLADHVRPEPYAMLQVTF